MEYEKAVEIIERVISHYKWCLEQKGVVDFDMAEINEAFNKIRNG